MFQNFDYHPALGFHLQLSQCDTQTKPWIHTEWEPPFPFSGIFGINGRHTFAFFFLKLRLRSERASAWHALVPGLNWASCLYRCKFRAGNCSRQRTQHILRRKWEKEPITPQHIPSSFIGKLAMMPEELLNRMQKCCIKKNSALWLWLSCYSSRSACCRMIWFAEM